MKSDRATRTLGPSAVVVGAVAFALSTMGAAGQQVEPLPAGFEYAVKFICGNSPVQGQPPVVARGTYFTAINVHNPSKPENQIVKKFAIALPGEKAGKISPFNVVPLKYDEALEIDCADILKHLEAQGFVKGFAIIQSRFEIDVVAVYTAAPAPTGPVVTLELDRVPARKFP